MPSPRPRQSVQSPLPKPPSSKGKPVAPSSNPKKAPLKGITCGSSLDKLNALQMHNHARRQISLKTGISRPDLIWDDKLALSAKKYAQHQAAHKLFLIHDPNNKTEGENLMWAKPAGKFNLQDAVQGWLDEEKDYHGEGIGTRDNFVKVGHYTQCIWPETRKVGIAYAVRDDMLYVVARYTPPGNVRGWSAYTGKVAKK